MYSEFTSRSLILCQRIVEISTLLFPKVNLRNHTFFLLLYPKSKHDIIKIIYLNSYKRNGWKKFNGCKYVGEQMMKNATYLNRKLTDEERNITHFGVILIQ